MYREMEEIMKEFGKVVKKRSLLIRMMIGILILFNIGLYMFQKDNSSLETGQSFQMGICTGLLLIGLYIVYKYETALKNTERLRKLYIQEHDERKIMIKQKMCQSALSAFMICMLLVISIAAYIDLTVAYTLIGAVYVMLFFVLAFKLYYSKKY